MPDLFQHWVVVWNFIAYPSPEEKTLAQVILICIWLATTRKIFTYTLTTSGNMNSSSSSSSASIIPGGKSNITRAAAWAPFSGKERCLTFGIAVDAIKSLRSHFAFLMLRILTLCRFESHLRSSLPSKMACPSMCNLERLLGKAITLVNGTSGPRHI